MPRRTLILIAIIVGLIVAGVIFAIRPLATLEPECGFGADVQANTVTFTVIQGVPPFVRCSSDGGYKYIWNFGDGQTATVNTITIAHQYAAGGRYDVNVKVYDTTNTLMVSYTSGVTVGEAAVIQADFTWTVSGQTVVFTGSASGGNPEYTYEWFFDDGSTNAFGKTVTHTYVVGTYRVILYATDSVGQSISATHSITIGAPPIKSAAIEIVSIDNLYVTMKAVTTGGTAPYTYAWEFGDGDFETGGPSKFHTYPVKGTYLIKLTVKDVKDSTGTGEKSLTVYDTPPAGGALKASFGFTKENLLVTFESSATGGDGTYMYAWDFGDGTISTSVSPVHEYAAAGTYTVTLIVNDGAGATETITKDVTVTEAPAVISPIGIILVFVGGGLIAGAMARRGRFLVLVPIGLALVVLGFLIVLGFYSLGV